VEVVALNGCAPLPLPPVPVGALVLGLKVFMLAKALMRVRPTKKCSSEKNTLTVAVLGEQRKSRLYFSCSISCRSERTELNACRSRARSSFSGEIEGRRIGAYSSCILGERSSRATFTSGRMRRRGSSFVTRPSSSRRRTAPRSKT
jgi:hypothetical protein